MRWRHFSRKLLAAFRRRPRPSVHIVVSAGGVGAEAHTAAETTRSFFWEWDAIDRAEAFKRDLMFTDLICLELRAHGQWVEVNEEMAGWDELVSELARKLPGALDRRQLYGAVMKPPFAECRTVVFVRSSSCPGTLP